MSKSHRVIVRMVALLVLPAPFMAESACAARAVEAPLAVTVGYDDLNLTSTQGVAGLYRRIQYAATEACRPAEGPQSVADTLESLAQLLQPCAIRGCPSGAQREAQRLSLAAHSRGELSGG